MSGVDVWAEAVTNDVAAEIIATINAITAATVVNTFSIAALPCSIVSTDNRRAATEFRRA